MNPFYCSIGEDDADMKKFFKTTSIVLIILLALFLLIEGRMFIMAKSVGYKTLKVFVYYKNTEVSGDLDSFQTQHFIVKNRGASDDTAEALGNLLEKSYNLIGKEFDYFPVKKTLVFIYGSMEDFWKQNKSLEGQAIMGLYHMGIIHLVAPEVFDMDLHEFEKNGPVLHEYTHKAIDELSNGNMEIWFTEGMALFQEYKQYGNEWAQGMEFNNEYTMEQLRDNFMILESVQAYKQSFEIVKDIYENYGKEKILELLSELRKGSDMDSAFSHIYGEALGKRKKALDLFRSKPFFSIRGDTK